MSSLLDLLYRSTMLDDVIFGSQIRLTSLAPSSHTEFSVRTSYYEEGARGVNNISVPEIT